MSTMSDKSHTQVILILGSKALSGSARQSHILLVCLIFAVEICTTNLEVKSVNPSIYAPKFVSWGGFGDLPSRHLCLQSCSSTGSGVGNGGIHLQHRRFGVSKKIATEHRAFYHPDAWRFSQNGSTSTVGIVGSAQPISKIAADLGLLRATFRFLYLFATADLGLIFQRPEYYLVYWGLLD